MKSRRKLTRYPLPVGGMRVNNAGLEAWSELCRSVAAELSRPAGGTPAAVPSGQATAATVSAARALIDAAGTVLASRVQTTATKGNVAATTYAATEEESATRLGAVPSAAPVV